MHGVYAGLLLTIALNGICVGASPDSSTKSKVRVGTKRPLDNEYQSVNSEIYNIITTITNKRKTCLRSVAVTGHGIGDVLNIPCSPNGVFSIVTDKNLVYGNPEKDSFTLFSDQPSTLILYKDGKCTKQSYKTVSKKTFAEISDLSEEDCTGFKKKVINIIEQESTYLEDIVNHVDDTSAKSSQFQTGQSSQNSQSSKSAQEYTGWRPIFYRN